MRMLGRRMILVVLAVTIAACTSAAPQPPATTIPITSFQMVAGKWEGTVTGIPSKSKDEGDWIEVTIGQDGAYDFGVYRTIGMFGGKGQFVLKDGKMTSQSPRGTAEWTLTDRGGKQYLRGEGTLETYMKVSADLNRGK
ncbi:MAG TPA: hypothetical protein VMI34_23985 [Candidatus Bathyarchaeia archaeon]|nr:hypothetical protein [Candidatus Bathyarchaeia archaeon]